MKRILSILLLAAMVACLVIPASAVGEPQMTYDLTTKGSSLSSGVNTVTAETGDIITVTFTAKRTDSADPYQLNSMQDEIKYDKSFFSFVDGSVKVTSGISAEGEKQEKIAGTRVYLNAKNTTFQQEQIVGTFQLIVTGTSGSGLVESTECLAYDNNGTGFIITPQNLKVTIGTPTPSVSVTGVELKKESTILDVGKSETLGYTVYPTNATNRNVTWESSNTDVATVDENGKVTAVGGGIAKITIKTVDGGYTDFCTVKVNVPVTGVKVSPSSKTMNEGDVSYLTETVLPTNATNQTVTWSSSNSSFVSVDSNGKITAKKAGTATITVTTEDGGYTAECTVTVRSGGTTVRVTGVELDKSSLNLTEGDRYTLTETVKPSDASNKGVTWKSSDESVAEVSQSGRVTAKKAGSCTITVTTDDGGYIATCKVTVTASGTDVPGGTGETYTVNLPTGLTGGSVTSNKSRAEAGSTVTLTPAPNVGYSLGSLTVTTATGSTVSVINNGNGTYRFAMPAADVYVNAAFTVSAAQGTDGTCPRDNTCVYAKYVDADPMEWYHDGVHFCVAKGYMNGVDTNLFAPNGTLSRGMIVTILWRIQGSPAANFAMTFRDVPVGEWYTEAIRWAQSTGVVLGYDAYSFGPNDNVTREQLAAILYRFANFRGIDVSARNDLAKYTDKNEISAWALENIQWANAVGIVNGRTETTIVPTGNATRAEAANMIQRFCETVLR